MPTDVIRVLVVEDNTVVQRYLKAALSQQSHFMILDMISDGKKALDAALSLRPDVILLDLFLPSMDGIAIIEAVMEAAACPIIVISGELGREDRDLPFEAQRAGAIEVIAKPFGMQAAQFESFSRELCHLVQLMSKVKVVSRKARLNKPPMTLHANIKACDLLLIGASTGGPAAIYRLLQALGPSFPFAVLLAQHIGKGFDENLVDWLAHTGCPVKLAEQGERLCAGQVYIAPAGKNISLDASECLQVMDAAGEVFVPNIDQLFISAAKHYRQRISALLLTGMGEDGAKGLAQLKACGALTIAQAEQDCVVFGMPKAAIELNAACYVMSASQMADALKFTE